MRGITAIISLGLALGACAGTEPVNETTTAPPINVNANVPVTAEPPAPPAPPVEPEPPQEPVATAMSDLNARDGLLKRQGTDWVPATFTQAELERSGMLCIRYNNFWCIKSAGWNGEIGKDERDHAIFSHPKFGARAFYRLMKNYRYRHNLRTTHEIFDRYAPADDCIGSLPRDPETGACPQGPNPTFKYAQRVAADLGIGVDDDIQLFDDQGRIKRSAGRTLARAVMKFEISGKYDVTDELLDTGMMLAGLEFAPE